MEEDLIIEIWDVFKEYISDKNKETAANHFVDMLIGKDVEPSIIKGLTGYDPHLDDAIGLAFEEEFDDEELKTSILEKGIAIDNKFINLYENLANSLKFLGRNLEAIDIIEKKILVNVKK